MKKLLLLLLVSGMLLVPFTAFGMAEGEMRTTVINTRASQSHMLTVDEMAEITGQAGVAIAMDDIKIFYAQSETWYQTTADWVGLNNQLQEYHGAVGLISGAEMFYVNAVLSANILDTLDANFYSPGRPLMYDYSQHALQPGGCNTGAFNFGNTRYSATLSFADVPGGNTTGVYEAIATNAFAGNFISLGILAYLDSFHGIAGVNDAIAAGSFDAIDVGFRTKPITIRVKDELDILSEALGNNIASMQSDAGIRTLVSALIGTNATWDPEWYVGRADALALNLADPAAVYKIAGVEIGLPTVELHTQGGELDIKIFALRNSQGGDTINPGNPLCDREDFTWNGGGALADSNYGTANSWSFGKLYYGNDTRLILDGFIEITPFEHYANPMLN